ncbi:sigma-54 interaction domain-containing protein [Seleniivibrio woodruffii]|uniref:sigma-54 interaction domain-containing protein n=1 Tax=Seleniivibrio woodruffii TaxID=1078050 RepID=UPI0039E5E13B
MINKELFLHDTMMNIFRSRDAQALLLNSLSCLNKYMPVDMIDMSYHLENKGKIIRLYTAENNRIFRNSYLDLAQPIKHVGLINGGVYVLKDIYEKFTDKKIRICPVENNSCLVIQCSDQNGVVGSIALKVYKENVYKSVHTELLRNLIAPYTMALFGALASSGMTFDNESGKYDKKEKSIPVTLNPNPVVGAEKGLKKTMSEAKYVAGYSSTVLITGETGTGKEVFANYIHENSPRKDKNLIKINCGAIVETLIDNELFGHEKGAFTGADSSSKGRFEFADKGTLFLDEIGELPLNSQTRLLRAIQFGEIERLGSGKTVKVDVRIIAATNKDLSKLVKEGRFREDLYWRLNVFPIRIPPLRERKTDIPLLVEHIIRKICSKLHINNFPAVSADGMKRLVEYDWPGNVRELENTVEREIIRGGDTLEFDGVLSGCSVTCSSEDDGVQLDDAMKKHILKTLEQTNWRISGSKGAANILGIHPNTLRHRMKKLGIL